MPVDRNQPVYPPSKGEDILATWGDAVSEHVVQRFATATDRDMRWSNPPKGALCVTVDTLTLWKYDGTNWVNAAPPAPPETTQIAHFDFQCPDSTAGGQDYAVGFPAGVDGNFVIAVTGLGAANNVLFIDHWGWGDWGGDRRLRVRAHSGHDVQPRAGIIRVFYWKTLTPP